jgi:protein-arginine kinase activator protein McsA
MATGRCESCRREPAEYTVWLASKSGRRDERRLCGTCAKDSERVLFGDGGLLMMELLEVASANFADSERNRTKVCPRCGNTSDRIKEVGEVGCAMCYVVFRDQVDRVIEELHGRTS